MGWVIEYKNNKFEAKNRLEAYEKELEACYVGMTSENIIDRVRRRNELLILINNLRTWLGLNSPQGENRMDYKITPLVRINL